VFVDALPATQVGLGSFRRNVVVVPEAAKIFNGTLAANIELGRGSDAGAATAELIRAFQLEEFVARFSLGLMTPIGEGGRQLSSGERQIVTLLRALLPRPAVLIVDEGLNAMDMELASLVLRLLRAYSREHAVLLISHNPALISWADRAYSLRDGRITARVAAPLTLLTDARATA
jgi:ABC-type bacteriocin/lantibiotic exporter with double-glycine peptidase domain